MIGEYTTPGEVYVIECESLNSGIPYADHFYITSKWCLSRVSQTETRMTIFNMIKYKKTTWGLVKSKLEYI